MDIGGAIKRLRKERKETQQPLADRLGVTTQTLSRWETGQLVPNVEQLEQIANHFGVLPSYIFQLAEGSSELFESVLALIDSLESQYGGMKPIDRYRVAIEYMSAAGSAPTGPVNANLVRTLLRNR